LALDPFRRQRHFCRTVSVNRARAFAPTPFSIHSSAAPGQPDPKRKIFPPEDGECILEISRSSSGSVSHPAGCFPFCFCPTSAGNRFHPASSATFLRKSPVETRGRTANDKRECCLRARYALSRRRIQSNL